MRGHLKLEETSRNHHESRVMFLIVSPSKSERSQSDFELMIIFWCVCVMPFLFQHCSSQLSTSQWDSSSVKAQVCFGDDSVRSG